jgi:hypothetical protein
MTTRTAKQLAVRVASSMNLLRPGENLSARFEQQFLEAHEELLAQLRDERLAYWTADEIPLAVFQPMAWLVALQVAPAFGAMPVLLQALSQPNADAARDAQRGFLMVHVSKDPHFETQCIDYF